MVIKFIKAFFYFVLMFVFIIVYGFTIHGYPNLLFCIIGIVISVVYMFLFFRKEIKGKDKVIIVLIVVASLIISSEAYLFINNEFDDKKIRTYYSVIYETEGKKDFFTSGWFFKNPEGKECFYRSYFDYYSGKYNDGDEVIVNEYNGVFKIKHYRMRQATVK